MNDFISKWKNDNKFKAKIKLLLYGIFILLVTVYAFSINNHMAVDNSINTNNNLNNTNDNKITIPKEYDYSITINIDEKSYQYYGTKKQDSITINKVIDDSETNYLYKDNDYYIFDNEMYIKTNKEEVYNIINYNYLDLNTINSYLSKSSRSGNQYLVYLKDIILEYDDNDYLVIIVNNNKINIDYTSLMKLTNPDIEKCYVIIDIKEKNERGEINE